MGLLNNEVARRAVGTCGAGQVQVRQAEIEAGWHHPGGVLSDRRGILEYPHMDSARDP